MSAVKQLLEDAVANGTIAGCACMASSKDGSFHYEEAVGVESLTNPPSEPVSTKSVFPLISSTKLMTAVAALQLVERGSLYLDQDVSPLIPELASQPVLGGSLEAPVAVPRRNPLLLKYLLSHSVGTPYPGFSDLPAGYMAEQWSNLPRFTTIAARFGQPLTFQPGENFAYGFAMDWVGRIIERVSGEPSLEAYMRKNIWEPLGIQGITFWPDEHAHIKSKLVQTAQRTPDGGIEPSAAKSINDGLQECFGGQGAYACVDDFHKILQSLLANDGKLLKPETVTEMFKPQLTTPAKAALNAMLRDPTKAANVIGDFSIPLTYDWNLAGLMLAEDDPNGGRKKGTTCWYGMMNFYWFIDVEAGLCGVFGVSLLPQADAKLKNLILAWQRLLYDGI
ncbi:Beta-lactamase-related protein [Macrophomina phaseolina MS6]|uniref:Beta-lactamase-related protein n=1 Tax=Macrophomina phaseolina (strain MS6) TaxID=1126212 RepID=K2RZ04_MACPH|nr:Beta-lactamase-related protein [Macrophomina phaseolina MS6]